MITIAQGLKKHRHVMVEDVNGTQCFYDRVHHCDVKKVNYVCMIPGCDYKKIEYYHYYYPPSPKDKTKILQKNKRKHSNHNN